MPELFPPRPRYQAERITFTYPLLFSFALLFALRLIDRLRPGLLGGSLNLLFMQLAVFALPSLIFIRAKGRGYARAIRWRRPYLSHVPLLIGALLALFSGSMLLSIVTRGISSLGNSSGAYESVTPDGFLSALIALPLLAVLPAITEELLFRGILCTELDRRGALRAVLLSALYFALIHFDLQNLPVYFFAGALLALVLYATDSLPAVMVLHAAYNIAALFSQRYLNAFYSFTGSVELFLFCLILLLLGSLLLLCREGMRLYRLRSTEGVRPPRRDIPYAVQFHTLLDALGSRYSALCILIAILGFILL